MKHLAIVITFFSLIIPSVTSAYGPSRQQVEQSILINASPEDVWAVIKDFGQLNQWHPQVTESSLINTSTRLISLNDHPNATVTEQQVKSDASTMTLTYKIIDMSVIQTQTAENKTTSHTALPVNNYKSWIKVSPHNGQSQVTWTGKFYRAHMGNPPIPQGQTNHDAITAVTSYYQAGLSGLKDQLENQ